MSVFLEEINLITNTPTKGWHCFCPLFCHNVFCTCYYTYIISIHKWYTTPNYRRNEILQGNLVQIKKTLLFTLSFL
ncbi:unnamed protein product [Meloidogyne enterolobii]|uniref:Uncharacterized protein n=1 Tax=Meloidogyne enterolobii TaxID=390850 RepID=A0ACB0XW03_MELEN